MARSLWDKANEEATAEGLVYLGFRYKSPFHKAVKLLKFIDELEKDGYVDIKTYAGPYVQSGTPHCYSSGRYYKMFVFGRKENQ